MKNFLPQRNFDDDRIQFNDKIICDFCCKFKKCFKTEKGSDTQFELEITQGKSIEKIRVVLTAADLTSNTKLRKVFINHVPGLLFNLHHTDMLRFLSEDKESMTHSTAVKGNGLISWKSLNVWVIKSGIYLANDFSKISNLFPCPSQKIYMNPIVKDSSTSLRPFIKHFCALLRGFYKEHYIHVIHILANTIKAIHKTDIMKELHGVSICNVSGPPNTGKTFACAIAMSMLGMSPACMLSSTTKSATLELCNEIHNGLVVWDDPRDMNSTLMSCLVHESFSDTSSATIYKGNRSYNSCLIIGTQEPFLELPETEKFLPTYSRIVNISMNLRVEKCSLKTESNIQTLMPELSKVFLTLVRFDLLQNFSYFHSNVKTDLKNDVLPRAIKNLALDLTCIFALKECGFDIDEKEVYNYFEQYQYENARKYCCRVTPFEKFCNLMIILKKEGFNSPFFKSCVSVDFKNYGTQQCIALYPKDLIPYLREHYDVQMSSESLHDTVRQGSERIGLISKNVNYKTIDNSSKVRRSIVIRHDFLYSLSANTVL